MHTHTGRRRPSWWQQREDKNKIEKLKKSVVDVHSMVCTFIAVLTESILSSDSENIKVRLVFD